MHSGQMPDNHDHQGLQEQAVRIGLGLTSTLDRGRHRDASNQHDESDKNRDFRYHRVASVLWSSNLMVRGRRVGLIPGAVRHPSPSIYDQVSSNLESPFSNYLVAYEVSKFVLTWLQ